MNEYESPGLPDLVSSETCVGPFTGGTSVAKCSWCTEKMQKKHKKQTIYIYIAYHSLPIAYQYGLYLYIVYMWFGNVWYIKIKT